MTDVVPRCSARRYFPGAEDASIPIFSFVGRLTLQKGVHLILNSVRELVQAFNGKVQILVGGQANMKDPYAAQCAWTMQGLRKQFPKNFWVRLLHFTSLHFTSLSSMSPLIGNTRVCFCRRIRTSSSRMACC